MPRACKGSSEPIKDQVELDDARAGRLVAAEQIAADLAARRAAR